MTLYNLVLKAKAPYCIVANSQAAADSIIILITRFKSSAFTAFNMEPGIILKARGRYENTNDSYLSHGKLINQLKKILLHGDSCKISKLCHPEKKQICCFILKLWLVKTFHQSEGRFSLTLPSSSERFTILILHPECKNYIHYYRSVRISGFGGLEGEGWVNQYWRS